MRQVILVGSNAEPSQLDLAKIVNSFRTDWNVGYEEGMAEPIEDKLKTISKYSLFKLLFFGGVLEILAQEFYVVEQSNT